MSCISQLADGKEADIPWYDFKEGKTGGYRKMQGDKDGIIIAEGIHMLNPLIFEKIRGIANGIYVAPRTRIITYDDKIVRPEQLMSAMISAFRVLTDPANTGAVCIAMPQDVEGEAYDYPESFFKKRVWRLERRPATEAALDEAAEVIKKAKRPMLVCGGGVRYSEAHEEFRAFAEATGIPFGETQAGNCGSAASETEEGTPVHQIVH